MWEEKKEEQRTPILAPPLARHGDPNKPRRKRRTIKPPKLSTSAVGTARIT
tara:strand:- start:2583 stop:2735 length:153 start_codon:yes stop_codon:yes gene_type:complete